MKGAHTERVLEPNLLRIVLIVYYLGKVVLDLSVQQRGVKCLVVIDGRYSDGRVIGVRGW